MCSILIVCQLLQKDAQEMADETDMEVWGVFVDWSTPWQPIASGIARGHVLTQPQSMGNEQS
jgi:hypothetical protein